MNEPSILTDIQQVTPKWLTESLARTVALAGNRVTGVAVVKTRQTRISSAYFLQVDYAALDATLPTRLFLKLPVPGQSLDREEIEFYQVLAPAMTTADTSRHSPFARCFDAAYSATPERSHLLLEDLSPTHFTNEGQMPPSEELCAAVMESYARFHAFWWEHAWLGQRVGRYLTDATINDFLDKSQTKLAALREVVNDEFSPVQMATLEAVAQRWPARRRASVVAGQGVTIVHRDPHPLNFLYPHDLATDSVKLIDWQSWRVDTGTDDLAYMMACHWPLVEHPGREDRMLARYWQTLVAAGVQGYGWEDMQYDYRASIIRCLSFLLIAWTPRHWVEGVWKGRVGLGLDAFARWKCGELLA